MEHGLKRKSPENGDNSHLNGFSLDDLNEDLLERILSWLPTSSFFPPYFCLQEMEINYCFYEFQACLLTHFLKRSMVSNGFSQPQPLYCL